MSRSRRHTPIFGGQDSGAYWKAHCAGVERTRLREHLAHERWEAAEAPALGACAWEWKEFRHYHAPNGRCWCKEWPYRFIGTRCYICERYGGYQAMFDREMRK